MKTYKTAVISFTALLLLNCSHLVTEKELEQAESAKKIYLKSDQALEFLPQLLRQTEINDSLVPIAAEKFQQNILANGLVVDYILRDHLPNIHLSVLVGAGKYHLDARDEQLSPLVLKLLKQGSQKYPYLMFQQQASLLGQPIQYWQSAHYSILSVDILPGDLPLALALMSQQVAFLASADGHHRSDAVKRIIQQQLLENKLTQSSGAYLAKLLFYQIHYPSNHLYYHSQANSAAIKQVTIDELMRFYQQQYQANNSRIILSGDIDVQLMNKEINRYFAHWEAKAKVVKEGKKSIGISKNNTHKFIAEHNLSEHSLSKHSRRFDYIERRGAQQIDLLYGMVTVASDSPDWPALKILAALLGGGPNSRLFTDLREQQGLMYSIFAQQLSGRYESPFLIQTAIADEKLLDTINGINNHLNELCNNPISESSLKTIKQQMLGESVFKLQTSRQLVNNKIRQLENGLSDDYLNTLNKSIKAITSYQLFSVAKQYFCIERQFIAVGQIKQYEKSIRNALKGYVVEQHQLPLE